MTEQETKPKRLTTVRDAAAMYKVSPSTILRAIKRGDIHAIRLGRCIRIDADALSKSLQTA
jgi:excisionase family DNA binding protein